MNLIINVDFIEDTEIFEKIYKKFNYEIEKNEYIINEISYQIQNDKTKYCPDEYFNYKEIKRVRKTFNYKF